MKKKINMKEIENGAKNILISVGLMHDHSEMIEDKEIDKMVGGLRVPYYDRTLKFGERAWRVCGKKKDLIVWDCGNGWYQIVKELKGIDVSALHKDIKR